MTSLEENTSAVTANYYNKLSNFQRDVANHVLGNKELHLQDAKIVLDLGCGTGNMTAALLKHLPTDCKIIAVDPDLERIKVAQHIHGCHDNISFQAGSSDSFPNVDKEAYDVVMCHFVLHWIKEKEVAFKNIFTSLKPGGRLVLTYPLEETFAASSNLFYRWLTEVSTPDQLKLWRERLCFISSSSVEELCCLHGFSVLSHTKRKQLAIYEGVENVVKYIYGMTNKIIDLRGSVDDIKENNPPPCNEKGEIEREMIYMILVAKK